MTVTKIPIDDRVVSRHEPVSASRRGHDIHKREPSILSIRESRGRRNQIVWWDASWRNRRFADSWFGPAPFRWTVYRLSFLTSSSCNFLGKRSLPPEAVEALGFLI